ncbi:hypothetical protein D3C78_1330790 [compost metagenome]
MACARVGAMAAAVPVSWTATTLLTSGKAFSCCVTLMLSTRMTVPAACRPTPPWAIAASRVMSCVSVLFRYWRTRLPWTMTVAV